MLQETKSVSSLPSSNSKSRGIALFPTSPAFVAPCPSVKKYGVLIMIKKLNRISLLTAGFALGTATLCGSPAFGGSSSGTVTVTANVQPYTNIVVTPLAGATFNINYTTGAATIFPINNQSVATVAFTTNVQGTWVVNPQSGNLGNEGKLVSVDTTAKIPYQVRIIGSPFGNSTYITPAPASAIPDPGSYVLRSADVADQVLEVTNQTVQIRISAPATRVPTKPTSAYTDTLTLVFTSDL
jgi:hypothetical protein